MHVDFNSEHNIRREIKNKIKRNKTLNNTYKGICSYFVIKIYNFFFSILYPS